MLHKTWYLLLACNPKNKPPLGACACNLYVENGNMMSVLYRNKMSVLYRNIMSVPTSVLHLPCFLPSAACFNFW